MEVDMEEIIKLGRTDTMTSLEIAEITGKKHSHVMRDIRSLLEQGVNESNFGLKLRINDLGYGRKREDPYYSLTPKGCLILASGYDAVLREKRLLIDLKCWRRKTSHKSLSLSVKHCSSLLSNSKRLRKNRNRLRHRLRKSMNLTPL